MSVGTARARARDFAAIAPTARAAASSAAPGRSARQRLRPRAAKLLAAARPMPLAAPVMTALRPAARAGGSVMAGLLFLSPKIFVTKEKIFVTKERWGRATLSNTWIGWPSTPMLLGRPVP